jgi:hypothetical protein
MFGLFSLSTIALAVLYGWGFVMVMKGAVNAGYKFAGAAALGAVWPLGLWKVMNDLWKAPPPSE